MATASPPAARGDTVAPLQRHGDMLFIRTQVNGKDVGLFLLDTGSTIDVIGQGVAGRLKLPAVGRSTAIGIGGPETFLFRRARTLTYGQVVRSDVDLAALYLNRFQRPFGVSVNGLIGFGALRDETFTIDYQAPHLTLHAPDGFAPPDDAVVTPMFLALGLPAVEARLADDVRVALILDTGADNHLTLPRSLIAMAPQIISVPTTGRGQSVGIGGTAEDINTWLRVINVFGVTLRDVPVTFSEAPVGHVTTGPPLGRIGSGLLRSFRLTCDSRTRRIWSLFRPHDVLPGGT